ncbi:hypothetical protein Pla110_05320 [Polystyrenella longa]|uniref:Uncharacterized protein n=1 Tax=Polystyrenella longa TaxID=2528007 RepID=A0A518CHX0_9PLAN|nr:hypothetical protein Pla110_05320 [Polystyrenella longa]
MSGRKVSRGDVLFSNAGGLNISKERVLHVEGILTVRQDRFADRLHDARAESFRYCDDESISFAV